MIRFPIRVALMSAVLLSEALTVAQQAAPAAHNDVLIKNAIVMTVTHGDIKNGSV